MKKTLPLIIFLLNITVVFTQNIDKINTFKKTSKFLKRNINKEYTFKEVFDSEKEADEEDFIDLVKKIDIDNNGYTDLIVNAYLPIIIILNNGNENYRELNFKNSNPFRNNAPKLDSITEIGNDKVLIFETEIHEYDETEYPNIKIKRKQKALSYNNKTKKHEWVIRDVKFKIDSLLVKYGELVTYKKNIPKVNKIKELYFSTSGCYGTCPIFEIKLTNNRNLEYNGKGFTKHIGKKLLTLDKPDFENLIGLLEYSELKKHKNLYSVNWTDDQTGKLKVIFENGEVKEIEDYGLLGSINLKAIYKKLFEINENIK
jgi:hypothetical protein